jgi:hypothetical protein
MADPGAGQRVMKFQKGQSGNPGGRPKKLLPDGRSLVDVAKEHTLDAIETLVRVCTDDKAPHAAQVAAASAILDRGWGRPTQMLGSDPDNPMPTGFLVTLVKSDGAEAG